MCHNFNESRRGYLLAWGFIPIVIGLGTFALSPLRSSSPQPSRPLETANSASRRFPLAISPDPVCLGVIGRGESGETTLSVLNTDDKALMIDRIVTSCPCISVGDVPVILRPGEPQNLKIIYNLSEDPNFEGQLAVLITCYLSDGKIGFKTTINLEANEGRGQPQTGSNSFDPSSTR